MTTATKLTPADVKTRLEEILSSAVDYAAAEDKMQRLARTLEVSEDDWVRASTGSGRLLTGGYAPHSTTSSTPRK